MNLKPPYLPIKMLTHFHTGYIVDMIQCANRRSYDIHITPL
uniref:ORF40b n=1 Tax=Pinus koraiensis TaxID=88728 RepID=A4QMJ1_PINKO|nr:ORF40b [Pinus koraiensis]ABP35321.1 ORF40b [Pinus koraiensis]